MESFPFPGLVPTNRDARYTARVSEYANDFFSAAEAAGIERHAITRLLPGASYYLHEMAQVASMARVELAEKVRSFTFSVTLLDMAYATMSQAGLVLEVIKRATGPVDRGAVEKVCRGLGYGGDFFKQVEKDFRTKRKLVSGAEVLERWMGGEQPGKQWGVDDLDDLFEKGALPPSTFVGDGETPPSAVAVRLALGDDGPPRVRVQEANSPLLDTSVIGLVRALFVPPEGDLADLDGPRNISPTLRIVFADSSASRDPSLEIKNDVRRQARLIRDLGLLATPTGTYKINMYEASDPVPTPAMVDAWEDLNDRTNADYPPLPRLEDGIFRPKAGVRDAKGRMGGMVEAQILAREAAKLLNEALRVLQGDSSDNVYLTGAARGPHWRTAGAIQRVPHVAEHPLRRKNPLEEREKVLLLGRGAVAETHEGVVQDALPIPEAAAAIHEEHIAGAAPATPNIRATRTL